MEVLYHFCPGDAVIALRVRIPRDGAALPSLCEVVPGAEVFERELHEMFGIEMTGLHTPGPPILARRLARRRLPDAQGF